MYSLPFRQIHLDFHTSETIPSVGHDFDAEAFAASLEAAHVNSVTCFSKCHHGMIYHPTKLGAQHPGLRGNAGADGNLLGKQIEACHKRGIKVPVYISAGLDEHMLAQHPDWVVVQADGRQSGPSPLEPGYHLLCFANRDYTDYLVAEINEVLDMFPVDGLFFDIIGSWGCCCRRCRNAMAEEGLDFLSASDRQRFSDATLWRFKEKLTAAVRTRSKDCGIFFNSGHVGPPWRGEGAFYSHLELESLPSGGWGYDHFPVTARYARNLGVEFLGMTGKFQTTWGDFGSFKNIPALEYECFTALALGGRCSVGDQLHPSGELTAATYDLIGEVYAQVEAKEPWCTGATPVTEVAVVNPEAIGRSKGRVDDSLAGAHRMLKESFVQYDVIDTKSDLTPYRVVILPDVITLDEAFAARINAYVAGGGQVLASYESGLAPDLGGFALEGTGLVAQGPYHFETTYLKATPAVAAGVLESEHVVYEKGMHVSKDDKAVPAAETIVELWDPYANRTALAFCSHQHSPVRGRSDSPAATRRGGVVYFAHPVFGLYKRFGVRTYKQLVLNALALLLPANARLVASSAPSTAEFTLNRQASQNRTVLHAMHYVPVRRADRYDVVEDRLPVYGVEVSVMLEKAPSAVKVEPGGIELPFRWDDGRTHVTIPVVTGHQLVVFCDPV